VHDFATITIISFAKVVLLVVHAAVDNIIVVLGLSFVPINMTSCITYHSG